MSTGRPRPSSQPVSKPTPRPSTGSNGSTMPPSNAASQRGFSRRMPGLSGIPGASARVVADDRIGGLVFDVDALIVPAVGCFRFAFLTPRRPLGGQGSHVQALAKQMNALQVRETLDQPSDAIVDGEPGLLRRRMTMPPPPATDRLLEGWGKSTFTTLVRA